MVVQSGRFDSIEGARGLMALWVVIGHLIQQSGVRKLWPEQLSLLDQPHIPVQVFVIVSGFVIANLVTSKNEPYHVYITRRLFRLAPLLWACLAFILGYWLIYPKVFRWDVTHTADYLVGYATMLHGVPPEQWIPDSPRSILPPAWSISLEWQFYLVAPLILWRRTWPFAFIAGLACIVFSKKSLQTNYGLTFDDSFLPVMLPYFFVGIGSFFVVRHVADMKIPFWAVVAVPVAVFGMIGDEWALVIWATILCSLLAPNFLRRALEFRPLLFLGAISYSVYLTHMIIMMPVRKQLLEENLGLSFGSWEHFAANACIVIPATLLVSTLTWYCIERPGQRLGAVLARAIQGRKIVAAPPAQVATSAT